MVHKCSFFMSVWSGSCPDSEKKRSDGVTPVFIFRKYWLIDCRLKSFQFNDNIHINRSVIRSGAGKESEQRQMGTIGTDRWNKVSHRKRGERMRERVSCYAWEMKDFCPLLMLIKCLILILFIIINSRNGPRYLNKLKWKDLKGDWRLSSNHTRVISKD